MVCGEMAMSMRAALHQLGVGGLVDQRHDLVCTQALGEHGRQDVGFLGVGDRGEHVGAVDVLLDQQFLVGGIPVQHDRLLQQLRDLAGAARVALDELHLVGLLERLGQAEAHVAAAGDDDAPRRVVAVAHLGHGAADVLLRGQEEHLVTLDDDRIALRSNAAAVAVDRHDAQRDVGQVAGQLAQGVPDQEAAACARAPPPAAPCRRRSRAPAGCRGGG